MKLITVFAFLSVIVFNIGHCEGSKPGPTFDRKISKIVVQVLRQGPKSPILPERILRKLAIWYKAGKKGKVFKTLMAITNLQRLYMKKKCYLIFSSDVCENSSAQPFFLWAKMYANKLTQKNDGIFRSNIYEVIRRGGNTHK